MKTLFYIYRNPGQKVFVKEADFFIEQGGLRENWGAVWFPVEAEDIEDARRIGEEILPPYGTMSALKVRRYENTFEFIRDSGETIASITLSGIVANLSEGAKFNIMLALRKELLIEMTRFSK